MGKLELIHGNSITSHYSASTHACMQLIKLLLESMDNYKVMSMFGLD